MSEKQQTEAEVIQIYGNLLEEANAGGGHAVAAATGACVYSAGSRTYCANGLTKAQCDQLNGTWTEGGRCP